MLFQQVNRHLIRQKYNYIKYIASLFYLYIVFSPRFTSLHPKLRSRITQNCSVLPAFGFQGTALMGDGLCLSLCHAIWT